MAGMSDDAIDRGWIGARLGGDPDWYELTELIEDSYRMIAPKRLATQLNPGR
jgi:predicted DNA-binding protein (MmcQ/YjbR family)